MGIWFRATDELQFGHGCDAVETLSSGKGAASSAALQFGHGCDAVETSPNNTTHSPEDRASIRPRL